MNSIFVIFNFFSLVQGLLFCQMNFLSPYLFGFWKICRPVCFICSSPSLEETHICSMLFIVRSSIALCLLQSWVAEVTSFRIGGSEKQQWVRPRAAYLSNAIRQIQISANPTETTLYIQSWENTCRRNTEWKLQQKNIQRLSITSLHTFFLQSIQKCRQAPSCCPDCERS